jgi:phosphate transport system permease protein
VGIGILSAGIILAIMIIPFIASVMRDVFEVTPPMLKESAYGAGLHHLGSGVQGGAALHQGRRDRRHHAGPGPRAGRDHGGHLRHRQLQPARFAEPVPGANSITSALANEFAEAARACTRRR